MLHAVALACLWMCTMPAFAQSDAKNSKNYADNLISSTGVIDPQNAVDNNRDNYAILRADIGILNFAVITVGFSTPGDAGESVFLEIQNDNGILTADVLQSIDVSVYNSQGDEIVEKDGFDLTEAHVIKGTSRYKLGLKTKDNDFDIARVNIRVSGLQV